MAAQMAPQRLAYIVRPGGESDWPMVADAWVQSHRASSRATKISEAGTFFPHHHRMVDRLLKAEDLEVRVAAPRDDDFTAYGFAVLQPGLCHMVYVKMPFRRLGIAKRLLSGIQTEGLVFTYWTSAVGEWIYDKYPGLKYNPFWSEII